uniref:Cytochrome b n=1 Tax=Haemonchus placei TaxID=6290 RepID=A0A0N4VT86_HAEPC
LIRLLLILLGLGDIIVKTCNVLLQAVHISFICLQFFTFFGNLLKISLYSLFLSIKIFLLFIPLSETFDVNIECFITFHEILSILNVFLEYGIHPTVLIRLQGTI